ncbi:unnamed protein product, partial [Polarella glacialis]
MGTTGRAERSRRESTAWRAAALPLAAATSLGVRSCCSGRESSAFASPVALSRRRFFSSAAPVRSAELSPRGSTASEFVSGRSASAGAALAAGAFAALAAKASMRRVARRAGAKPLAWRGDKLEQSSLPLRPDGKLDYESIDSSPVSQVLMGTVRQLLADSTGHDSPTPGYDGLMELAREANDMEGSAEELQQRARKVFEGILPAIYIGWIPPLWKKYIQPNLPTWSTNFAFFCVFYLLFPWLMGPMEGDDYI